MAELRLHHEDARAQWRQGELGGEGLAVHLDFLGLHAAHVALIAAAVDGGVAVQHFAPEAGGGQADAVVRAEFGREMEDDEHLLAAVLRAAQEGEDAVQVVGAVHPLKAFEVVVGFPERGVGAIDLVEVGEEALGAGVLRALFEQGPVERVVLVPLGGLAELAAPIDSQRQMIVQRSQKKNKVVMKRLGDHQ